MSSAVRPGKDRQNISIFFTSGSNCNPNHLRKMLKHSISHYGSTGVPLQSPHQLTSSSHSADTSLHHLHQSINDPTRFLEGPPTHHHSHSH
ncbi:unnamed protein product, partial [Allacma fusca]